MQQKVMDFISAGHTKVLHPARRIKMYKQILKERSVRPLAKLEMEIMRLPTIARRAKARRRALAIMGLMEIATRRFCMAKK